MLQDLPVSEQLLGWKIDMEELEQYSLKKKLYLMKKVIIFTRKVLCFKRVPVGGGSKFSIWFGWEWSWGRHELREQEMNNQPWDKTGD